MVEKKEKRFVPDFWVKLVLIAIIYISIPASCKKDIPDDPDKPDEETVVPFDKVPSLSNMVVYEVNMQAFGPDGTFDDVISRLDSIKSLGVNVVWLMPVYPEGELKGVGSPYCVKDYLSVNPDYGTTDDLKELVKEAHQREMAVILDWVANHTSWDNEWISNDSWYVKDAGGNIIIPPGTSWQDVAELNYNNSSMRAEMIKSMKFWISECNIDGFRCDAVDYVPFDFWKQAVDSLKAMPGRNLILLAESGKKESLTAGFQMNYSWDFKTKLQEIFSKGTTAASLISVHNNEINQLISGTSKLRYITNHDIYAWENSPSKQYVNSDGAVTAFVITAFMGGVPLICSGQEIGYPSTISFFERNPIDWTTGLEIFSRYKKIMQFRKENSTLISGQLKTFSNNDILAFSHTLDNSQLLVIANVRNAETTLQLATELKNTVWINVLNLTEIKLNESLNMKPFEFLIFKNKQNI
jgi:glycosidase